MFGVTCANFKRWYDFVMSFSKKKRQVDGVREERLKPVLLVSRFHPSFYQWPPAETVNLGRLANERADTWTQILCDAIISWTVRKKQTLLWSGRRNIWPGHYFSWIIHTTALKDLNATTGAIEHCLNISKCSEKINGLTNHWLVTWQTAVRFLAFYNRLWFLNQQSRNLIKKA